MLVPLIVASWSLTLRTVGASLTEPYAVAQNSATGSVDPKAKAVADDMCSAYRNLKTLRCTVIDRTWSTRARFAFERPGTVLMQKLSQDRPSVDMELRVWDRKLVVSSPENKKRYLQTTIGAQQTPLTALADESRMMSLQELAGLLEGTPPYIPKWVAGMSLGVRTKTNDGTPVDVLTVMLSTPVKPGSQEVDLTATIIFQVGVDDHLIRREEAEVHQGRSSSSTLVEYEDVMANKPIPPEVFTFNPAEGAIAVDRIKPADKPNSTAEAILSSATKALAEASSLSFVDEWTENNFSPDENNKVSAVERRATVRFDLQRPLFAYGELTHENRTNDNVLVVSDGVQVFSRKGALPGFLKTSLGKGYSISDYGGQSVLSEAWAARLLVRGFYAGTGPITQTPGIFYRLVGSQTVDGTACQTLEISGETNDSYGIPSGLRWANRVFVGQEDHLPRRFESERQLDMAGKVYTIRETDRFTRIISNASMAPSHFAFDEMGGTGQGATQAVPALALVGDLPSNLPRRTLDGKTFSMASLKGKVVIIDAYTYSCVPCRLHMLGHLKLVSKYAAKGVTALGLILDDESSRAIVKKFVASQKLTYPQLLDGKGWNGPTARQFGIASVPFTIVIGRDGRVAYVNPSYTELEQILTSQTKN